VVAPEISGNPGDSLWVLLRRDPSVALWTAGDYLDGPILHPDGRGGFLLRGDFRAGEPERRVSLPAGRPVFFVATDPLATRSGWVPAGEFLAARNPGLREVARFVNPADATRPPAAIAVFRIR
jgi:hypothetical protein